MQQSELGADLAALGQFIGLLTTASDGSIAINKGWFADPLGALKQSARQIQSLVQLINSLVGPAVADPPNVFPDAQWYRIPSPISGETTVFHVITPKPSDTAGEIGLGVLHDFAGGNLTIQTFLYVPAIAFSSTGLVFIAGSAAHPCQFGLRVISSAPFTVNSTSFNSVKIKAEIFFADQTPSISLEFDDTSDNPVKGPLKSLDAIRQPKVVELLLEVIAQSDLWLRLYVADLPFTAGDLLEAAHLLKRQETLQAGNIRDLRPLIEQLSAPDAALVTLSSFIWKQFSQADQTSLLNQNTPTDQATAVLVGGLNTALAGASMFDHVDLTLLPLSPRTMAFHDLGPADDGLTRLNLAVLQDAYGIAIQPLPYKASFDELQGNASDIALSIVFGFLDVLSSFKIPLIELPGGGIFVVRLDTNQASDYGLRVAAQIPLSLGKSADGTARPAIDICLGSFLSGESEANSWVQRSLGEANPAGLSLFGLRRDASRQLSFVPGFVLSSFGANLKSGSEKALIDLGGYTLQGVEARVYLAKTFGENLDFGAAVKLHEIGLPLGPGFGNASQGQKSNLVAESLVQSGPAQPGSDTPKAGAVNPAFSISFSGIESHGFNIQFYDPNDNQVKEVTIPLQRSIGPLHCEKLGLGLAPQTVGSSGEQLSLSFDGGVKLGALDIELVGLTIGIPVTNPGEFDQYSLDLDGFGLTFASGGVELSGALIKVHPDGVHNFTEYDGAILVKAGSYALSAVGAYAFIPDQNDSDGFASMFVFGVLDGQIGGPGFFFITGLAAGFGYNRALTLPDADSVASFPLVMAANDPTALGGSPGQLPDPTEALKMLGPLVKAERGEFWLAAGVKFTSFDIIHSTALLVVEFGNQFEIALLGLSWMSLPTPTSPVKYVYAELGLEVKLLPSEGVFSATAILTPNSYVLDPACHLTGGFAFYVWFGNNPHAGEFVLTLGGYHPDFLPPAHYPVVPRLGFNWPVSEDVTISGEAYFALTPTAVMAGGGLEVLYDTGWLQAWFKAQMDALIEWAPFHYELDLLVSIGVSCRINFLFVSVTVNLEIGASVALEGPPTSGTATVHLYIVSFTVPFGPGASATQPLDWSNDSKTGFADTLLPAAPAPSASRALRDRTVSRETVRADDPAPASSVPGILSLTVNDGLLGTFTRSDGSTVWIVRPNHFLWSAATVVPASEVDFASSSTAALKPDDDNKDIHIRPMKVTLTSSNLTVGLQLEVNDKKFQPVDLTQKFQIDSDSRLLQAVPPAKWGNPETDLAVTDVSPLPGRLMGLQNIHPLDPMLTPVSQGFPLLMIDVEQAFTYEQVDTTDGFDPNHLPLQALPDPPASQIFAEASALQNVVKTTLTQLATVQARRAVIEELSRLGFDAGEDGDLSALPEAMIGNPLIWRGTLQ